MEEELKDIKIQTTYNEANIEDLIGEAKIENNVNEKNIEEVEDAN